MNWRARFADIHECGRDLGALTTWKIGGSARDFLEPRDADEARLLFAELHEAGERPLVLGGGANMLIGDGEIDRPVIHLGRLVGLREEGDLVVVAAGYPFLKLVGEMARAGRSGIEGLAGIPGQMGGICRMNAGGRWGEIRDVIEEVELVTPAGELRRLALDACGFSYRASALDGLVLAVTLRLGREEPAALRARVGEYLRQKGASQPLKMPSGGCVFANPEGTSAGRLVDELGLKGERVGDAQISTQHGNFIVNLGQARCVDVMRLIELIEAEAMARRGIVLRREIGIWTAAD